MVRYVDEHGGLWVLLQQRADWSHHGGTWGLPGGARDSDETAEETALRETGEEVELDLSSVRVVSAYTDEHGGWSYVTTVADCDEKLSARPAGGESADIRWVPEAELSSLPLHPGLAESWQRLRRV